MIRFWLRALSLAAVAGIASGCNIETSGSDEGERDGSVRYRPNEGDAAGSPDGAFAGDAPSDLCAQVQCAAETHCVVNEDGRAECISPKCGDVQCAEGQVCCNASCGICAAPEDACIQIDCSEESVRCGEGFGRCPGFALCTDDPRRCVRNRERGTECDQVCDCPFEAECMEGNVWNASPSVCACEPVVQPNPCVTVLCPQGTGCQIVDGAPRCVAFVDPDPCRNELCPLGTRCAPLADDLVICEPIEGEVCGKNVCADGMVCCNASCGICAPPGSACIQIACEPWDDF